MKTKRILLHLCILLLAALCIFCAQKAIDIERKLPEDRDSLEAEYADHYNGDMDAVLRYVDAQIEYLENYSDPNEVVLANKEFGNVKVKDLADFFNKEDEYVDGESISLENTWDDLEEKLEEIEAELEEWDDYYGDENEEEKKQKQLEKIELEKKVQYYEELVHVYKSYFNCVSALLGENEKIPFTGQSLDLDEYAEQKKEEFYNWNPEFRYSIQYKVGKDTYQFSNVEDEKSLETEDYESGVEIRNGIIYCGENNYHLEYQINNPEIEHPNQITKARFAIDISEEMRNKYQDYVINDGSIYGRESSFYTFCREQIVNAPTESTVRSMKNEMAVYIWVVVFAIVLSLVPFVLLMLMAGHRKKGDEPKMTTIDRGWWDLGLFIVVTIYSVLIVLLVDDLSDMIGMGTQFWKIFTVSAYILGISATELTILFSESFARRVKAKNFWKTTFIGKLWGLVVRFGRFLKKCIGKLWSNLSLTIRVGILGIILLICVVAQQAILGSVSEFFSAVFICGIPVAIVCYIVWRYFSEVEAIQKGAKRIAEGEVDYQNDEKLLFPSNRQLQEDINRVGEGIQVAVADSIKNERMKTELITNVSHDLKTPLTSIINYVDLLKADDVNEEQRKKYLEVLSQKSQRLKNLTEDLVEASKLNSGVAKMELGKLDLVQLVNQSLAEYDERFAKRKLQVVKTIQEEPLYVMADGRKTWRLLDNLYNNVAKYAMSGTRVYVDIYIEDGKAKVSVKNISEGALNFSAEELMERFVRGDVSRTTEGSGLGLSIAKSIADRQGGDLEITLDGDLFKVTFKMDLCR